MAQENKSIKDALTLLQDIQLAVEKECKSLLDFVSEFAKRYEEEKRKLPYHLNVIDELHINENAHSRILMKLLCYQNDKDEYEILQSLLGYMQSIKGAEAFNKKDINIDTPTITQEEQRIDLWIRDKGYAIIFENKIYNAIDQEEQICRYIEKTKTEGYKVENIYVIYLSQDGKEPEEQTWGDYKEEFKDRYLNLSFRYNILPWLREHVLPNISLKDVYLKCAIKQYIDYLEGLFNLRTIQKPMIMNLREFIQQKLELEKKDPQERISSLGEMLESCNKLSENLFWLMRKELLENIKEKISGNIYIAQKGELFQLENEQDWTRLGICTGKVIENTMPCIICWEEGYEIGIVNLDELRTDKSKKSVIGGNYSWLKQKYHWNQGYYYINKDEVLNTLKSYIKELEET